MASGTSPALPNPTPTWPFWSPTTTRAAKLKRRPPFTTLAQRFTKTTFSTMPSAEGPSRLSRRPGGEEVVAVLMGGLEGQAALAGGVGEDLDLAVVAGAVAVEDDRGETG